MSDEKCPSCGDKANGLASPYGDSWDCGSRTFNDRDEFAQSDLCRIRQRDALLAECFGMFNKYGLSHQVGCEADTSDGYHPGPCTCHRNRKLAALRTRYKEMQK